MRKISPILLCLIIALTLITIMPTFVPIMRSSANSFIVQKTAANTAGTIANSGTTSTITVHSGNGLIIVAGFASGNTQNTVLSCSDNLAQSWTQIIQQNVWPLTGTAQTSVICYHANTVGGSDAFTVTASTSAQGLIVIAAYEVTPALSFTGLRSQFCSNAGANSCITNTLPTDLCGISFAGWNINMLGASLVLSVMGGTPVGTKVNMSGSGFDSIDQRNIVAGTNSSQIIAEGTGLYLPTSCLDGALGHFESGVAVAFGPFTSSAPVCTLSSGNQSNFQSFCSFGVTTGQIIQTGDLIVVSVWSSNSLPTQIFDNSGDGFTLASIVTQGTAPTMGNQELYIATAVQGGLVFFSVLYGVSQNASLVSITSYHSYVAHTAWSVFQETHLIKTSAANCNSAGMSPITSEVVVASCTSVSASLGQSWTAGSPFHLVNHFNDLSYGSLAVSMATEANVTWSASVNPTVGNFFGTVTGTLYENIIDVRPVYVSWGP